MSDDYKSKMKYIKNNENGRSRTRQKPRYH